MTTATTVMPTRDVTIGDTFVRISGQGFPLVFVHGFTTTSEFWREQAEEFSKAYRVIRINLPGHGASPAQGRATIASRISLRTSPGCFESSASRRPS
jgi:pimeloyl-ACP methyl ester carboxylesterase